MCNRNRTTRRVNVLFSLMLVVALLASCGGGNTEVETTDGATSSIESTDENNIFSDLPTGNFDGAEFVFANEIDSKWAIVTLDTNEINGEVINDAIFNRNRLVEDRLNVKISCQEFERDYMLYNQIVQNVLAGDDPISVIDLTASTSAPLILDGYFLDSDTVGIDTSKPWWNSTVMDSLTFAGKSYSFAGDVSVMLWDASYCFMFNKKMAADLQLEDHYDLVRNGEWTIDKAAELMKSAAIDLNGNSRVDTEDQFGLNATARLMSYMLIASGEKIVPTDKDGLPEFTGLTQSLSDKFDKIYKVFFDTDDVFIAERKWTYKDDSKNWHSIFLDGQSLYFFEPVGSGTELRDSSFDYGYLPLPKYDSEQEHYITPIIHFAHVMHVTKCHEDTEMISTVLENLCAESYRTVKPAFFKHIVEGKRVQDDATIEMFDYIFEHQVMNPACIYDWGKICTTINNAAADKDPDISSKIAGITPAVKDAIQKTIEYYSE